MSDDNNLRVLVFGNVNGCFEQLKIMIDNILTKNGKFNCAFLIGKTFSDNAKENDELLQFVKGDKVFPLPIYFIDSSLCIGSFMNSKQNGLKICENLFYLGRTGVTEISGLRVCFICGIEQQVYSNIPLQHENHSIADDIYTGNCFLNSDIEKIINEDKIDILLTNQWPYNFDKFTDFQTEEEIYENLSIKLARVVQKMSPRYIFSSNIDISFQRAPYINSKNFFTRFIALGSLPSPKITKKNEAAKYVHALQLQSFKTITDEELKNITGAYTKNPFEVFDENQLQQEKNDKQITLKDKKINKNEKSYDEREVFIKNLDFDITEDDIREFMGRWGTITNIEMIYGKGKDGNQRFKGFGFVKYDKPTEANNAIEESNAYSLLGRKVIIQKSNKGIRHEEKEEAKMTYEDCWFCFFNKNIEKHLIIYQGKDFYVALPKGPINNYHFLIIPKYHFIKSVHLDNDQKEEMQTIKEKIIKILKNYEMDYLLFERSITLRYSNANHMHLQIIGIPALYTLNFDDNFKKQMRKRKVNYEEISNGKTINEYLKNNDEDYFYAEFYGMKTAKKRKTESIIHIIKQNERFSLQFGREITCHLLEIEEKIDWKKCQYPKEAEEALALYYSEEYKKI